MPVRPLVAARTKTTRFRRLHRKPVQETSSLLSFPFLSKDPEDRDSDTAEEVGKRQFVSGEMNDRAEPQYSPVRQVLQSEMMGEEIRPDEMVKGYEVAPGEYAAIDPQEIRAAEIETSDTIDLFHFVKAKEVDPIYFERSYYVIPAQKAHTHCCSKQCGRRSAWDRSNRDAPSGAHADSATFGQLPRRIYHVLFERSTTRTSPPIND
jgi:Ku70/Ku80 beta-barrel domain